MDYDGFLKSLTICVSQRVKKQGRCVGIPEVDRTYKLKGFSCRVKLLGGKSDMCQQRRTTEAQTPCWQQNSHPARGEGSVEG